MNDVRCPSCRELDWYLDGLIITELAAGGVVVGQAELTSTKGSATECCAVGGSRRNLEIWQRSDEGKIGAGSLPQCVSSRGQTDAPDGVAFATGDLVQVEQHEHDRREIGDVRKDLDRLADPCLGLVE